MLAKVKIKDCKSILSKSGIGGVDFAVNPYTGCLHGCVYCYATFMKKYSGHTERWGTFVDVKINAPEILDKNIHKAIGKDISIGTVTDGYQPVEKQYQITRRLLQRFAQINTSVFIQTKSDLILRDLDIISSMANAEVCWTITTLDEEDRRVLEPGASPIRSRLDAMERFSSRNISVCAFLGPIMPFIDEQRISKLITAVIEAGVRRIYFDRLNYAGSHAVELRNALKKKYPEVARRITGNHDEYYQSLAPLVESLCKRAGIDLHLCY